TELDVLRPGPCSPCHRRRILVCAKHSPCSSSSPPRLPRRVSRCRPITACCCVSRAAIRSRTPTRTVQWWIRCAGRTPPAVGADRADGRGRGGARCPPPSHLRLAAALVFLDVEPSRLTELSRIRTMIVVLPPANRSFTHGSE